MINFDFFRNVMQRLLSDFTTQIIHVVIIVVIFSIIRKLGKKLLLKLFSFKMSKLQRATPESLKQKETIKQMSLNIFGYAVTLIKFVFIISVFIPITTLMASVGAVAIVITFAFQNMLSDIVRGFFIIFEEMSMVGEWIEVAGFQGEVLEIGLRTTKLKLFITGEIVLIPNSNIGNIIRLDIDRLIKERDALIMRQ